MRSCIAIRFSGTPSRKSSMAISRRCLARGPPLRVDGVHAGGQSSEVAPAELVDAELEALLDQVVE